MALTRRGFLGALATGAVAVPLTHLPAATVSAPEENSRPGVDEAKVRLAQLDYARRLYAEGWLSTQTYLQDYVGI